jgi:hypothetical protein
MYMNNGSVASMARIGQDMAQIIEEMWCAHHSEFWQYIAVGYDVL